MAFNDEMFNVNFAEAKKEVESGSGEFTFANKEDKLVVKVMYQPDIDTNWYASYQTFFDQQAKPVTQYLVKAVLIDLKTKEKSATVLVLKPSQLSQFIGIAQTLMEQEGINLLHPISQPVSLTKEGTGMQTKYKVAPLTKQVDCSEFYEHWTKALDEYVGDLTKKKEEKASGIEKNKPQEVKLSNAELDELFEE